MNRLTGLIYFFTTAACQAATYHVDWTTGNDANPGTLAQPWKRCPGMATSAVAQAIVSTDSILFRRDQRHEIDSAIIVKSGVSYGAYGTGARPILDGGHVTLRCFDARNGQDNWTVTGLHIEEFGSYPEDDAYYQPKGIISAVDIGTDTITTVADHNLTVGKRINFTRESGGVWPAPITGGPQNERQYFIKTVPTGNSFTLAENSVTSTTINLTGAHTGTIYVWECITTPRSGVAFDLSAATGSDNVLIDDCFVTKIGQYRSLPPSTGTNSATGYGVLTTNGNNITISNCEMSIMRNPVAIGATASNGPAENITVIDCDFSHFAWGIDIKSNSINAVLRDILVRRVVFRDYQQFDSGAWLGFSDNPHSDGIFLRSGNLKAFWENIHIDACEFYKDNTAGTGGGTASIYLSQGPSALITNCTFIGDKHSKSIEGLAGWPSGPQVVRIYNNTFVNSPKMWFSNGNAVSGREWHVENNIFLHTNQPASNTIFLHHQDTPVMAAFDYNVFWNTQVSEAAGRNWDLNPGGNYMSYAGVLARGFQANGSYADPLLTRTSGLPSTMDLRPLSNSVSTIGRGKNLSAYFTTDKDGNPRPSTGAWDAGAYVSGITPPSDVTAPTLISAVVDTEGDNVIMTFDEPTQGINLAHYAIAGHSLSSLTGSGTTWGFTISPIRTSGANFSMTYTGGAGRTADIAGNLFASGTYTITNGSLAQTPVPKPGFQGRGAKSLLRR
jgi:hypothetical protein